MPEYRIKPGGMHEAFQKSTNKIQVIGGGFGNGKTAGGVIKALRLIKAYPGCNGLIAMATYAQLNDTIREEVYKWVPPSSVKRWPTMADNTMIFKNGSKLNFRYIQQKGRTAGDGQTSSNLLSATYDFAVVDQIENPAIVYKDFLDILGRLRGSTPKSRGPSNWPKNGPRWLILLANPSFNWVFHKIIKPMKIFMDTGQITDDLIIHPETKEPLIDLFEASTYENKHNLEKDFIETLEAAYTGQFRKRYLGGEWGAFEGLVYPSFNQKVHMVDKKEIQKYLFREHSFGRKYENLEGFDFGIASPTCFLQGFQDYLGRVMIYDGFYQREAGIDWTGEKIISLRRKNGMLFDAVNPMISDPAIFKRTIVAKQGQSAKTIDDLLFEGFDILSTPGQNDILTGIAKVASYLEEGPIPNPFTGDARGPMLYFASHLTFIPDEFGSYFWKMKDDSRIDQPIDKNDHAMDTLKYMFSKLKAVQEYYFRQNFNSQEFLIHGTR